MGSKQDGSFQAIQEYFQQKFCRFCHHAYTEDGIELIRQEPGLIVVRIGCNTCNKPLGVAIVGCNTEAEKPAPKYPPEWTKKDVERLTEAPPITYDDVISAHQFLRDAGGSWSQYVPEL